MILILAVGQKQPTWVNTACSDYLDRFTADYRVALKEIKAEPRSAGKTVSTMKALEAERIEANLPKDCVRIALDERGKALTTAEFSKFLESLKDQGRDAAFIIGGPDGIDDTLKADCHHQIRLSSMTLPHGLARVLLAEQIYRAWSLMNNHPYHRA